MHQPALNESCVNVRCQETADEASAEQALRIHITACRMRRLRSAARSDGGDNTHCRDITHIWDKLTGSRTWVFCCKMNENETLRHKVAEASCAVLFQISCCLPKDETPRRSYEASLSINELLNRPDSLHDFERKRALLAALVLRM